MSTPQEPIDPEVAGEMGRMAAALDAEVRAEHAEYEAMAVRAAWRARRVADVAREWMVRGDQVEATVAGVTLVGEVEHVGADLLVLGPIGGGLPVDVALAAGPVLRVVAPNRSGRRPPGPGSRTFLARMTEHETDGTSMTVTLVDGRQVSGTIEAVAVDHLLLASGNGHVVVPLNTVALAQPDGG